MAHGSKRHSTHRNNNLNGAEHQYHSVDLLILRLTKHANSRRRKSDLLPHHQSIRCGRNNRRKTLGIRKSSKLSRHSNVFRRHDIRSFIWRLRILLRRRHRHKTVGIRCQTRNDTHRRNSQCRKSFLCNIRCFRQLSLCSERNQRLIQMVILNA